MFTHTTSFFLMTHCRLCKRLHEMLSMMLVFSGSFPRTETLLLFTSVASSNQLPIFTSLNLLLFSPLSWQLETTAASIIEKAGIVYITALGKSLIVSLLGFIVGKFSVL